MSTQQSTPTLDQLVADYRAEQERIAAAQAAAAKWIADLRSASSEKVMRDWLAERPQFAALCGFDPDRIVVDHEMAAEGNRTPVNLIGSATLSGLPVTVEIDCHIWPDSAIIADLDLGTTLRSAGHWAFRNIREGAPDRECIDRLTMIAADLLDKVNAPAVPEPDFDAIAAAQIAAANEFMDGMKADDEARASEALPHERAWKVLAAAADTGDVLAAGLLLIEHRLDNLAAALASFAGIYGETHL